MAWRNPLPLRLVPTEDADSFRDMPPGSTGLPLAPHPGAFAVRRRHHVHEGVDLYAPAGTPVSAIEAGEVLAVRWFTGPALGHSWWLPTHAVWVAGASGVVVYGEISPQVTVGQRLAAGDLVGTLVPVLTRDKGRPMSMLHLELRVPGSVEDIEWLDAENRPLALRDPTPWLQEASRAG